MKNALDSNDRFEVYHDLTSKTRFCSEHQRVCSTCERVSALDEEKSGWALNFAKYVSRIELVNDLFTNYDHRNHDNVDPNTVRYLLYSLFSKSSFPKVHFAIIGTLLIS